MSAYDLGEWDPDGGLVVRGGDGGGGKVLPPVHIFCRRPDGTEANEEHYAEVQYNSAIIWRSA